jgi:CheY-like chemotaxis protein/GAF domain-containing protein
MSLKQVLSDCRDDILARFVREVERKDLPPPGLPRSVLVDHIPVFLDEIGVELSRGEHARLSMDAIDVSATARQHGEQRWKLGYDLEAIVREYGILRHAILEAAKAAAMPPTVEESDVLAQYLNVGIAAATAEYVRSREEQLKARQADLTFLSEAGELLGSSLDYASTLGRLTRLLVPRLGDFCVVHLEGSPVDELPIVHVNPAKVALVRDALRMFQQPEGLHTHAEVVRTGKSVLVEAPSPGFYESIARSSEHLAVLNRLAATSWMGVPLQIKNQLFGTISLAWSDSGRHYGRADLLLAEDLARRAAAAIDNARLYALSSEERAHAEAATRSKDEFIGMVSQELRTPLSVIIGWVRLLRNGSLSEQIRNHALDVIERNAGAQDKLVSDLLDISRANATTAGASKKAAPGVRQQDLVRPSTLAGLSVLVVDDENDVRDLLRVILESSGMEVHDAASAGEGMAKLEREAIDLIISDVAMPAEDGYSFIRAVRTMADKDKAHIPAVALTALTRNEDRRRALLEGFNVHMSKPVEPAELLVSLADLSQHLNKAERPSTPAVSALGVKLGGRAPGDGDPGPKSN